PGGRDRRAGPRQHRQRLRGADRRSRRRARRRLRGDRARPGRRRARLLDRARRAGRGRRMDAGSVRAPMRALREAGWRLRGRSPRVLLATLARALERWSDPESSWRRELESKLPAATGFTTETVRRGLVVALADWNGAALERLAERELAALRDLVSPGF